MIYIVTSLLWSVDFALIYLVGLQSKATLPWKITDTSRNLFTVLLPLLILSGGDKSEGF